MFCSTIIATVGRTSLTRAVKSVLCQPLSVTEHEIIVVNDSGNPLAEGEWHQSPQVQFVHTNRRERSVARNTGAAVARGRYFHFLDDDDWLLEDALGRLCDLADSSDAAWIYGATQLVDRQGSPLIQLRHDLKANSFTQVMAGEWVSLQSSLIDSQVFHQIGGFNTHLAGPEDIDLLRRIAIHWDLEGTSELIACVSMGEQGSTTNYAHHGELSRWAREEILDAPNAFSRMRSSAYSAFWYGRIVRAYLTSAVWNVQHKRLFKTLSRSLYGLSAFGLARQQLISPDFWRAVLGPYASETFERGIVEAKASRSGGPAISQPESSR